MPDNKDQYSPNAKPTDDKATTTSPSEAFPEPTKAEVIEARKQGIKDAVQQSTKEAYLRGANEGYGDSPTEASIRDFGPRDVMQIQQFVDLTPEALKKRIKGEDNQGPALTQAQVAGLLEVERSGKNRTDIVKVLCDELGVDSPYEVTAAGPAHTNDVSRIKGPGA